MRTTTPLSRLLSSEFDRLRVCNICRLPSTRLEAWRECDERDRLLPGDNALVYIAVDHPLCLRESPYPKDSPNFGAAIALARELGATDEQIGACSTRITVRPVIPRKVAGAARKKRGAS